MSLEALIIIISLIALVIACVGLSIANSNARHLELLDNDFTRHVQGHIEQIRPALGLDPRDVAASAVDRHVQDMHR